MQLASSSLVGQFEFPISYNLLATFLGALTGTILATKKGYDIIGVGMLALVSGAGGGLIRDGIFLQQGPVLFIQSPQFIAVVFLAVAVGSFAYHVVKRFDGVFFIADSLGLGIYGVIGAQMTLNLGLGAMAALIIGFFSAVGGGILRDVMIRKEPVIFFPGQFYSLVALTGISVFLFLGLQLNIEANLAAIIAISITFILRIATVRFNLQSAPIAEFADVNGAQFNSLVKLFRPVVKTVQRVTTIKK